MRGFWNNSKGLGNLKETVEDDGIMTFEQWNQQNNMMLKRDFKNKPIPENALQWRFWYFDRDRSGILSWWEYWSTIQEDHLQHWHFNKFFNAVDGGSGEGDNVITRQELTDYYTNQNEDGALTPQDIDQMVDDFFKKYLRGNYQGDENDQIRKRPLWGIWHHWENSIENRARRIYHKDLYFDENLWFANDENRDLELEFDELIGFGQMQLETATELFEMFEKDPLADVLTYSEFKAALSDMESLHEAFY